MLEPPPPPHLISFFRTCATFDAGGGSCEAFCPPPPPPSEHPGAAPCVDIKTSQSSKTNKQTNKQSQLRLEKNENFEHAWLRDTFLFVCLYVTLFLE